MLQHWGLHTGKQLPLDSKCYLKPAHVDTVNDYGMILFIFLDEIKMTLIACFKLLLWLPCFLITSVTSKILRNSGSFYTQCILSEII